MRHDEMVGRSTKPHHSGGTDGPAHAMSSDATSLTRRTAIPARAATLQPAPESRWWGAGRSELWAGRKSWPASADLARAAVLSPSGLVGTSRDAAAVGLSVSLIGPLQCHLTTCCLKFFTQSGTLEISRSHPVVRVSRAACSRLPSAR